MWETLAIIVTLGGLELTLWLLDRCTIRQDHEMQRRQMEILDGSGITITHGDSCRWVPP